MLIIVIKALEVVGVGAAIVLLLSTAALGYTLWRMLRLPANAPHRFLKRGRATPDQCVVVCLGASMVHGRAGVNFVDLVAQRLPGHGLVNAGFGGDMLLHAWQRLDSVIACDPDFVVVLCGTNDVQGILDASLWRRYRGAKRLAGPPSLEGYRETLHQIIKQLKTGTHAQIGVCSLPVLGEDLASPANQLVCQFNAIIRQTVDQESVRYLPVFERESIQLTEHQQHSGPGQPFVVEQHRFLWLGRVLQHFLLGRSFDDISARNGLLLKTDLIHGNSREAAIIADEIVRFLEESQPAVV